MKYGIAELKHEVMDDVSLDEISQRDAKWCAIKFYLILGCTNNGTLTEKVFEDPECYYGHLMVALEQRIRALGGKVMPMESIELPTP